MNVSRPRSAAFVATGDDAPLIDERAATRGRMAAEGGDGYGGVENGQFKVNATAARRLHEEHRARSESRWLGAIRLPSLRVISMLRGPRRDPPRILRR